MSPWLFYKENIITYSASKRVDKGVNRREGIGLAKLKAANPEITATVSSGNR